ncbi:hypothetical protein GHT06_014086 [Daphnia sinensis]|uniref:Uncharacterized protein n=1 Tax=Daphnia sinensis TaxID=1820382 RepID=A0AAD5KT79_9CRUS|nr:hypothetical protein GHT06_014086 [Daphnia sinensis]
MFSTVETGRLFCLGVSCFYNTFERHTHNTVRWAPLEKGHGTMVFAPDDQASDKSFGHSSFFQLGDPVSRWDFCSIGMSQLEWNAVLGYEPTFWIEALPNQPPASPPLGRLLMATRRELSVELANGRSLAGQLFSIFQGKAGDLPGGSFH